jgi:hypothetical protein
MMLSKYQLTKLTARATRSHTAYETAQARVRAAGKREKAACKRWQALERAVAAEKAKGGIVDVDGFELPGAS